MVLTGGQIKLSLAELESYKGQGSGKRTGKYLRYYCPIHGGDHQRSLQVNPETGHFQCFACGAWGYLEENKQKWIEEEKRKRGYSGGGKRYKKHFEPLPKPKKQAKPVIIPGLLETLKSYQYRLTGSIGEKYLSKRGIPLEIAQKFGVGYSPGNCFRPGKIEKDWKWGRVIFPHTNPGGEVISFYGRAVGEYEKLSAKLKKYWKSKKHRHLPGVKGVFNARALSEDTVFIGEGVFDSLSLIMAGYKNSCSIFGVNGLRWEWVKAWRIVFCLDNDSTGLKGIQELCWEGKLRGKDIYFLSKEVYQGYKDLNELWVAKKRIDIGDWIETEPTKFIISHKEHNEHNDKTETEKVEEEEFDYGFTDSDLPF